MKKLSMNKTRWAAMLLCGALLLPLAACKPKETPPVSSNPTGKMCIRDSPYCFIHSLIEYR